MVILIVADSDAGRAYARGLETMVAIIALLVLWGENAFRVIVRSTR